MGGAPGGHTGLGGWKGGDGMCGGGAEGGVEGGGALGGQLGGGGEGGGGVGGELGGEKGGVEGGMKGGSAGGEVGGGGGGGESGATSSMRQTYVRPKAWAPPPLNEPSSSRSSQWAICSAAARRARGATRPSGGATCTSAEAHSDGEAAQPTTASVRSGAMVASRSAIESPGCSGEAAESCTSSRDGDGHEHRAPSESSGSDAGATTAAQSATPATPPPRSVGSGSKVIVTEPPCSAKRAACTSGRRAPTKT